MEILIMLAVVALGGFMIVGATVLIVDTLIQWKREKEIAKRWKINTF
jgi:hypothetical protein